MNIFQHKNIIKPPLLPFFLYLQWFNLISSFIQWSYMKISSFAYSWILMKTFVMKEKILEKLRDVHIKWQMFTYHVFQCIKPSANSMLRHCTFTIMYNMKNIYHYIFMNFNETRRNEWKIAEKSRGCTSKITHISVVKCPIAPKLILSQCIDTTCLPKWSNLQQIKYKFSWILMKT